MTIYLIRALVDPSELARWGRERGWVRRGRTEYYDEDRVLHHLVTEMFGRRSIQPFRLYVAPGKRTANLYGYSQLCAKELKQIAKSVSLPDADSVLNIKNIQSKGMPYSWKPGQKLGFDVRVRPIIRRSHVSKSKEIDAFIAEAQQNHPKSRGGMIAAGRSREAVYSEWLADRLTGAANLESVRMVKFNRSVAIRNGNVVEGPDAVFQGNLVITNTKEFESKLSSGIGRHRSFGYGMILLRPPNQNPPKC